LTWRTAPVNEGGIIREHQEAGLSMIVCSCNVLSDHQVRAAASAAARRSTSQIYCCLGCSAQCGRCARTIRKIIDEALGAAKVACPVGCAGSMHAALADNL
jgi:bacterioferritin-associated ferredoxin